jgi:hypothetical protein
LAAFHHGRDESHQTINIELTPAVATGRNKAYEDTMQELNDFQIYDDSGDGFEIFNLVIQWSPTQLLIEGHGLANSSTSRALLILHL